MNTRLEIGQIDMKSSALGAIYHAYIIIYYFILIHSISSVMDITFNTLFLHFRSKLHIFAKCKSKIIHNNYKAVIMDKAFITKTPLQSTRSRASLATVDIIMRMYIVQLVIVF